MKLAWFSSQENHAGSERAFPHLPTIIYIPANWFEKFETKDKFGPLQNVPFVREKNLKLSKQTVRSYCIVFGHKPLLIPTSSKCACA